MHMIATGIGSAYTVAMQQPVVLTGANFIGASSSTRGSATIQGIDPASGAPLAPAFFEATADETARACTLAAEAFGIYSALLPATRSSFLRSIADRISELGDTLLERANAETALPVARLQGERARTIAQLRMFAGLVDEGSWVDARIDRAMPDREPIPRPDIRRMLVPLGPVAVFGASNFPLAFSVAGGDTVSALAAGCPVVVKAHPAHPGTSELVARAILDAAGSTPGIPDGVFSMVHGASVAVGQALVTHPAIKAVGFTGSLVAGRALFDAAAERAEPIPVYAEMGSSNPVFILPEALATRGGEIAKGLAASITLGAGQFCTNPGVTIVDGSADSNRFLEALGNLLEATSAGTMVAAHIAAAYSQGLEEFASIRGVTMASVAADDSPNRATAARAALLVTDSATYLASPPLARELYGPATLAVRTGSREQLMDLARGLHGHLTATVHGTESELVEYADLVAILERKAGRVVINGFPTGVEVAPAMHHGGPYPATSDARATSVGTAAILRFARPVCLQGFPSALLPEELRDENPRGIWRTVDGVLSKDEL